MSGAIGQIGIGIGGAGEAPRSGSAGGAAGGGGFADVLKGQIDEVVRLQQDASRAVENLSLGKSDDVVGVMTAMEKSDVAFKTLLAIRSKLMEAYDEVRNIPL
jgi:flagellar hook-basal body complex protein FliE